MTFNAFLVIQTHINNVAEALIIARRPCRDFYYLCGVKSTSLISAFFLLWTILAAGAVCAEPLHLDGDSAAVEPLPEITVTAIRPYDEVIPAQRLDGEQLENLNAHSVADALRYFSGAQVKDYGGVGGVKTIDVRGMGSNHTGVFYDGIQITNAQNGQVDLGRYSLDNIEEISMYNGQKSEIFQPARDFGSATSVYIRTRRPSFKAGKRYNLDVTLRTGSFGLLNPAVRYDMRVGRNVTMTASAEYTFATGRYKFRYRKLFSDGTVAWDTTATRNNGMIHALRAEATFFGTFSGGRWSAKGYFYDSSRGIPGAIVNNVWKNSQRQWDRNIFFQGSVQRASRDGRYEWMVNAKYSRDYMRYLNPDTTLMYIDNSFNQDEVYLSTSHRLRVAAGWDVSASADWQWDSLDSDMVNFSYPNRNMLLVAVATAWRRRGFKAQGSLLLTEVCDHAQINGGSGTPGRRSSNFHKLTPAVFVGWQPWETGVLNLRGFYKKIFRMPTFNDLYYTDIGNAKLKPEYAVQYDIGASCALPGGMGAEWLTAAGLSCDLYYNRVTDKIIAVPKGTGQYRWMMMNIGEVHVLGLDAALHASVRLPGDVDVGCRLSYSYERARDFSDPADNLDAAGTYKGQIAYIPLHSGSLTAEAGWRRLGLNYSFIYVGERYHNSSNIAANYEQPWYTHDMSLHYLLPLPYGTSLKATFEINNIFNQQYEVIQNYPMPGRNYRLTLRFSI